MREIKFRAWDVENKKMIQSYAHLSKWGQFYTTWTSTDSEREYIPMQYTGLKDKNGVEIYQGDIVKHYNGIKEVKWDIRSGAWDMCLSDYVVDQEDGYEPDKIEVIGNIYENQELLKGGVEVV